MPKLIFCLFLALASAGAAKAQEDRILVDFYNRSQQPAKLKVVGSNGVAFSKDLAGASADRSTDLDGDYYYLLRFGSSPGAYTYWRSEPFSARIMPNSPRTWLRITFHDTMGGNYAERASSQSEFDNPPKYSDKAKSQAYPRVARPARLVLEGGTEVSVYDWTFCYRFWPSDKLEEGFTGMYGYTHVELKDLAVMDSGKERIFPANTLREIDFFEKQQALADSLIVRPEHINLWLKNMQRVDLPYPVIPVKRLLTDQKYAFGNGSCPCLYFEASMDEKGPPEQFEILLGDPSPSIDATAWTGTSGRRRIKKIEFPLP